MKAMKARNLPEGYHFAKAGKLSVESNNETTTEHRLTILEDASLIPQYFINEINDTINKVQANAINKSLVLNIITDTHNDDNDYFKYCARNILEVNKELKSDAIIHLGDMINGNDAQYETAKKRISNLIKNMQYNHIPVFVAMGNHDDNSFATCKQIANLITKDRWYGITQRQNEMIVTRIANKPYYYIDYPVLKIKLIFLCAIDYSLADDGSGNAVSHGANWWGYGQDQLVWLGESALNTSDDYGVLVFSHMPTRAELNYANMDNIQRGDIVEDILRAYTMHENYTYTEGNKTFNYTVKSGTEVIAFIYGHTHGDSAKTVSGVKYPYISIACSLPSQNPAQDLPVDSIAPARTVGTVTQDCWDVLTVRRDERKLYFTRFGAGDDRIISY